MTLKQLANTLRTITIILLGIVILQTIAIIVLSTQINNIKIQKQIDEQVSAESFISIEQLPPIEDLKY